MPYFACFQIHEDQKFRLDTRIYLREKEPGKNDRCVAAIIGKNPGSADTKNCGSLMPISLDGDKLLPYVRNRFRNAYDLAGVEIPIGAYVQVWNLFYLCNKSLPAAIKAHSRIKHPPLCASESEWPPIVWFAWGPPTPHFAMMKTRFLGTSNEHAFYYDMELQAVVAAVPELASRVKHTQGLPAEPIEKHIASIIRSEGVRRRQ